MQVKIDQASDWLGMTRLQRPVIVTASFLRQLLGYLLEVIPFAEMGKLKRPSWSRME